MNYLGVTRRTVEWLLANNNLLEAFKADLKKIFLDKSLAEGVIVAGSLRLTSADGNLLSVWHNDYLSGTDTEDWGFVRLVNGFGIMEEETIYPETLERCLNLISIRLQGHNLPDDRWIHRVAGENTHTCTAGRGDAARKQTLGWYEDKVKTKKGMFHSLVIIGPSDEPLQTLTNITAALEQTKPVLSKLVDLANDLLVKARQRPVLENKYFTEFKNRSLEVTVPESYENGDMQLDGQNVSDEARYETLTWGYSDWIRPESPLTKLQREILQSDIILQQPLRIIGAAGTGKSLLMQLLAMRRLEDAKQQGVPISVFYIVHNSELETTIRQRFSALGADGYLSEQGEQRLIVKTLFAYSCEQMNLDKSILIDKDASQTKMFQRFVVRETMDQLLSEKANLIAKSELLKKVSEDHTLRDLFADIIVSEIGVGIKGHDLNNDRRGYVDAERPLTRFHSKLIKAEREFVYEVFLAYDNRLKIQSEWLDSDDVAISYLGILKTPLWDLKRKKQAFDFVFIDETQLFNQNERQIFRFLTKRADSNLPIAIALDEAQELRGNSNSGFGVLGIEHLANETLPDVYRSTREILNLAFFIIQRTTDLFGTDFPDFTKTTISRLDGETNHVKPTICSKGNIGVLVKNEVSNLRRSGVRQIAIIVHAERHMADVLKGLRDSGKENIVIAEKRGEYINPKKPIIYVSRPELIGGQEFDAVIAVGLEHGLVPPIIDGHAGLMEALEQQSLREMYLSFTRAKTRLSIINALNSTPTTVIQNAIEKQIIEKKE